jgi:hypothetical protein
MTNIFTFLAGQSCCSALNSWAAQQRRPAEDAKILIMHAIFSSKSSCGSTESRPTIEG